MMGRQSGSITVAVAVYNVRPYVEACIRSILGQSTRDFRILVVDDGSTDGSGEICEGLLAGEPGARYLRVSHRGIGGVRNFLLDQADTDYILFVDGDDRLGPDAVERLSEAVRCGPDLVVYGFWYETGTGRGTAPARYAVCGRDRSCRTREEIERAMPGLWDAGIMYSVCNKLFRTDLIAKHKARFKRRTFGEDLDFCMDYLRHCRSLTVVSACLYHYLCQRKGSISSTYRPDLFEIRVREHRKLQAYFSRMGCDQEAIGEFLARRHIERVVGCIANECSADDPKPVSGKLRAVRAILEHPDTAACADRARLRSWKMRALVAVVRSGNVWLAYLMGRALSEAERIFPQTFTRLKMRR